MQPARQDANDGSAWYLLTMIEEFVGIDVHHLDHSLEGDNTL